MSLKCGLVGLPNSGKSTLFNALTKAGAPTAPYPFCTIEPNIGVMEVADDRLAAVAGVTRPAKTTPATVDFVDIAGLVKGANRGEGLGNQFLAHIREVDAIIHVVRAFEDALIPHVDGSVDPVRDMATVNTELLLADLETLDHRQEKIERKLKTGEPRFRQELAALKHLEEALGRGKTAREALAAPSGHEFPDDLFLLTAKPVLYVANLAETSTDPVQDPLYRAVADQAAKEGASAIAVPAKLEAEIAELSPADQAVLLKELGWPASTLPELVRRSFQLLDLISFFTVNENELRAWTVRKGTPAPVAAGKVHSSMGRGFIRAEAVGWADLVRAGSMSAARDAGLIRVEGREYRVHDGDVLYFRFNP